MAAFDWKSLVSGIAPAIGTALGGPLAGIAIQQIADKVLGNPAASKQDVINALSKGQLTGDQIVALKKADQDFDLEMKRLDLDVIKINQDTEKAYLTDVQDARARQIATKDNMPQIIFFLLLGVYVLEVLLFYFGKIPSDEFVKALITRAFSTAEIGLTGAIAYFIGSSRGSKTSGDTVRAIAESKS